LGAQPASPKELTRQPGDRPAGRGTGNKPQLARAGRRDLRCCVLHCGELCCAKRGVLICGDSPCHISLVLPDISLAPVELFSVDAQPRMLRLAPLFKRR